MYKKIFIFAAVGLLGAGAGVLGSGHASFLKASAVGNANPNPNANGVPFSHYISSNSLDFDEFVDGMTLDADTTVALDGHSLNIGGGTLFVRSDGKIGVGTTTPDQKLDVAGNIVASASGANVLTYSPNGSSGFGVTSYRDSVLTHAAFTGRAAKGTANNPLAVTNNTWLNLLGAHGYDGSGFTNNTGTGQYDAAIIMQAGENFGPSNHGTYMAFFTTPTGTISNIEAMRLAGGNLGVGTTVPQAKLDVKSDMFILETSKTPASSTAPCVTGAHAWDANYVYVCVATNTWKRAALSAW